MDEVDQALDVLDCDGFASSVKEVEVTVEDLDRYSYVHTTISDSQSSLQTLKNPFVIFEQVIILGFILTTGLNLGRPPEMAGNVYCTTLIRLLEEFGSIKCTFRYQGVIIFMAKVS